MLGKIEGKRRRGRQRMRWLDGITNLMDMSLSNSRSWWWTGRPGVLWSMGSQRGRHEWATELNNLCGIFLLLSHFSRVQLCDPMDCSLPGSSIHGIFQARILEWGAIAFYVVFSYYLTNYTIYLRRWSALPQFLLHYIFRVNWSALFIYLPLWIKALPSKKGLQNSMQSLEKTQSTREEMATHSSTLAWKSSWTVWKGKKIWHQRMIPQDKKMFNMLQRKFS